MARLAWNLVGALFAWAVLMGFIQKGVTGYLLVFGTMVVGVLGLLTLQSTAKILMRYTLPLVAVGVAVAWLALAGSYSYLRDAVGFVLASTATLLLVPEGR